MEGYFNCMHQELRVICQFVRRNYFSQSIIKIPNGKNYPNLHTCIYSHTHIYIISRMNWVIKVDFQLVHSVSRGENVPEIIDWLSYSELIGRYRKKHGERMPRNLA